MLLLSCLALLLCASSCATDREVAAPSPTGAAGVIAQVGPYPIEMADLEQAVAAIFGEPAPPASRSHDDLRVAVDALIAARVLVLEAERRGVDRESGLVATLDSLQAVLLRDAIYEHHVYGDLPATSDSAVAGLYEEWGRGQQVRGAHILLRTREKAEAVIGRLGEGADFADLAREHSQHTESRAHGGVMGYLRASQYPPAITAAIWDLGVGEHGREPVRTTMGWHAVAVTARRTLTLEDQRTALVKECQRRQRLEAKDRFVAGLRASFAVVYHPETAVAVASLHDTLSGQRRLFSWRDGELNLAAFLQRVQVPDPVSEDTARMRILAEGLVFDELAAIEAEARGYLGLPEVRKRLRDKRFKLIGEHMFAAETSPEAGLDEVRAFFEEHREAFRSHTVLTIREILVAELALADSLHQLIGAGQDMEALARAHTTRTDLALTGGLWADVRPADPRSAKIYDAGLELKQGLHPPLKIPGGYSVFEVLHITTGPLLSFDESEASARTSLEGFRMEALIERLRVSFSDRISIDEPALEALAGRGI